MKIHKLKFKNLNSLYGEWEIDFTLPEYVSNGIFAITGPTGAGKSTILDAICLALYGRTPRLGRITNAENEIMSRQTGDCYAEVVFESQAGRFKCTWSQHRARKQADGKLAAANHQIVDFDTDKIIEARLRDVLTAIEKRTGMDFERFTRSILLAQGGFDSFLKADPDKRAPILEQITGTQIYSVISTRVHEMNRGETEKLNALEAQASGVSIMTDQEELLITNELENVTAVEVQTQTGFSETVKAIQWLANIVFLQSEIAKILEQTIELSGIIEAFKPERERLNLAQKASELDGEFATLTAIRAQQQTRKKTLEERQSILPKAEELLLQSRVIWKKSELQTNIVKDEQKLQADLIQKTRTLDTQLSEKRKTVAQVENDLGKIQNEISVNKKTLEQFNAKLIKARSDIASSAEYIKSNACDELLVTQFAGIEQQISGLQSILKDMTFKNESVVKAREKFKIASQAVIDVAEQKRLSIDKSNSARRKVEDKKKELEVILGLRTLREYRLERDLLLREFAFVAKIADLELERSKLEDGRPCPLCGSKEHPFAQGNIPEIDDIEQKINIFTALIEKAEQLDEEIRKLSKSEQDASANLVNTEFKSNQAENDKKNAEKHLTDLEMELSDIMKRLSAAKDAILTKLRPLGIEQFDESQTSSLLSRLINRLKKWQQEEDKKEESEKQIADLTSEMKSLESIIQTHNNSLNQKQDTLTELKSELQILADQRNKLFGTKDPDIEEVRLHQLVSEAEIVENNAGLKCFSAEKEFHSIEEQVKSLKDEISELVAKIESLETDFADRLRQRGFVDENSFTLQRLPVDQRSTLSQKAKEFDDKNAELTTRRNDREKQLTSELEKNLTTLPLETLRGQERELDESLKQIRAKIGGIKQRLADNEAAKEKIQGMQAVINQQRNRCDKWRKLDIIIGSSDGKKYRNFAQGLTFELMVFHANMQLEKMTDRYLLIRDEISPLELNVVDNYQAGEIRSTKNLSGGESFIVSLALALGLSKMASRKVRVDSLFLDEGFGTLDEYALDTALETLSGLHQDGKLIGVISHVSAMKERISTQINISPISGGKSGISGPGCRQSC